MKSIVEFFEKSNHALTQATVVHDMNMEAVIENVKTKIASIEDFDDEKAEKLVGELGEVFIQFYVSKVFPKPSVPSVMGARYFSDKELFNFRLPANNNLALFSIYCLAKVHENSLPYRDSKRPEEKRLLLSYCLKPKDMDNRQKLRKSGTLKEFLDAHPHL